MLRFAYGVIFSEIKRWRCSGIYKKGFQNWKKVCKRFKVHVRQIGSAHNNVRILYFAFKNQKQSVTRKLSTGNESLGSSYRIRLTTSVNVVRLLLGLGLDFRGNDEPPMSIRGGNFLELLSWYGSHNVEVGNVIKDKAPETINSILVIFGSKLLVLVHQKQRKLYLVILETNILL